MQLVVHVTYHSNGWYTYTHFQVNCSQPLGALEQFVVRVAVRNNVIASYLVWTCTRVKCEYLLIGTLSLK